MGTACEGAASVVFSWLAGLLPSASVFPGQSWFLSLDPLKQSQRGRNGTCDHRRGGWFTAAISLLPGILARMRLLEPPEGGQLSREDPCLFAGQPPPTGAKYQQKSE